MKVFAIFALLLALGHTLPPTPTSSKISPQLSNLGSETTNIFVSFIEGTTSILDSVQSSHFRNRGDHLTALSTALQAHAKKTQQDAVKVVEAGQFSYKSFWLTNQLFIRSASQDLILSLAQIPNVLLIEAEHIVDLDPPAEAGPILLQSNRQNPEGEWGVQKIKAREARALLSNATSDRAFPVIISTIDTGARHTHEALRHNWVGDYGWMDPYDSNLLPMDINGHGTHTTGTICGQGGIGVYPEAFWMACRGCATSSCSQFALTACAEWIACPTLSDGTRPDCSKAPHLVSNSWGGGRGATWFDPAIATLHAANVIVLFSIGNSGPSCNTANSPGDRDVIGVGSTTVGDTLSTFSSVGPTIDGRMKPEISAPGSDVISAYNTADNAYRSLSGTSMACPHAAGLTAILKAYNPDIRYAEVKEFMHTAADKQLSPGSKTCEGIPDHEYPNHHFGHGRIDAFASLGKYIESRK